MTILIDNRRIASSTREFDHRSCLLSTKEIKDAAPETIKDEVKQQAAAFFSPQTASEVAHAVKFAIQHNLEPTLWTYQLNRVKQLQNSVIIDLQKSMRNIHVDTDKRTITFDASVTIGEVDQIAAVHGLAVVGGTCAILRLGGVLVGGGYGYLTGQYGLVTDNLISAQVVLADGRLVTASRTENEDLFWGIQGSYTNLGIITSFTIHAHPLTEPVFWAKITYPESSIPTILSAIQTTTLSKESCISLRVEISTESHTHRSVQVVLYLFHNGPKSTAMREFQKITSLPNNQAQISMLPYQYCNEQLNQTLDHNSELDFCSTGVNIRQNYTVSEISQMLQSLLNDLSSPYMPPSLKSAILGIDYRSQNGQHIQPFSSPSSSSSLSQAAFAARHDGPMLYLRARWVGGSDDELVRGYIKNFGKAQRERIGLYRLDRRPGAYPGFCSQNDLTPQEMFGENYGRLVEVKKKYDPKSVFNPGVLGR